MVLSRAKAAPEETSTTVSTSSITLPIVVEVVDAPASMYADVMVSERAGTVGKGHTEHHCDEPYPKGGRVRAVR
jgi:hypothetical protein